MKLAGSRQFESKSGMTKLENTKRERNVVPTVSAEGRERRLKFFTSELIDLRD
jgi:hypothetical protein